MAWLAIRWIESEKSVHPSDRKFSVRMELATGTQHQNREVIIMGQQQLLVVMLVSILMGISMVVAINVMGQAGGNANEDAVRQDMLQIAVSSQGYYMRSRSMRGGGGVFFGITFNRIGHTGNEVSSDGRTIWNDNGVYVISDISSTQFNLTAHPASRIDGDLSTSATAAKTMKATIFADELEWIRSTPGDGD